MVYNIEFIWRKAGALGIIYKIKDTIKANNEAEFIEKLYKKYDSVHMLKVNGKLINK